MTPDKPEVGVEEMCLWVQEEGDPQVRGIREWFVNMPKAICSTLTDYAKVKAENERLKKSYQIADYKTLTDDYFAMRERAEKAEAELRDLRAENERLWKSRAKEIVNTALAARRQA